VGTGTLAAALVVAVTSMPASAGSACAAAASTLSDAAAVYVKKGQQAFVERFVRGSPLAERMAAEGAEQLRHIEAVLGPIQGFSVISRKSLGARSCYVVGVLEYTNGPAFTGVLYYARPEGSVPISLRLEAEPDEVFTYPVLIGSD
jgi:hypothetical protein